MFLLGCEILHLMDKLDSIYTVAVMTTARCALSAWNIWLYVNYLKLSAKLGSHVNKTVHFENLLIFILVLKVVDLVMFDLDIYMACSDSSVWETYVWQIRKSHG